MGTTWRGALQRVATALARRRSVADAEDPVLSDESGFTLIELMVVLVIMGILMAIAIPTFLGVTSTANDTSTQSNLANVITSAKAIYAKTDAYPTTAKMAAALKADEPEFKYAATTTPFTSSAHQNTVAVLTQASGTGTTFIAIAYMTKTSECWVAKDTDSGSTVGVKYGYVKTGMSTTKKTVPASDCTVTNAATAATVTFGTGNKWPAAPTGH